MATQKTWGYNDALANFRATSAIAPQMLANLNNPLQEGGASDMRNGGAPQFESTWEDVLRNNAYQTYGEAAFRMTPQQLEAHARQNGILGAKEQGFGEIAMEGLTGPLALPALFTGAGLMSGAFAGGAAAQGGLAAGGAMDMGGLGTAEAMGLGGGYTSPALGAAADGLYTFPGEAAVGNAAYPAGTASSSGLGGGFWSGVKDAAGPLKEVAGLSGGLKNLFAPVNDGMNDLFGNDWGAKAAGSIPILAAMDYAKSQSPFDTSRLESTYNEFDPSALAYEYDQNTAKGRDSLTSSLQSRGVMGSSFGNNDITNFQTSRDLGRRSLVNQGLAARGGLASSLLDAQVKERALKNDLYGRSLMALGNVLGGRR